MKQKVDIFINDEETKLIMALGKKGEAYFVSVDEE